MEIYIYTVVAVILAARLLAFFIIHVNCKTLTKIVFHCNSTTDSLVTWTILPIVRTYLVGLVVGLNTNRVYTSDNRSNTSSVEGRSR